MTIKLFILLVLSGPTLFGQSAGRPTIEGVWRPTDIGRRLAAFDSLAAGSGTYELNGSTATFRPIVAKGPNMVSIIGEVTIDGDTLTLTWASRDMRVRVGENVVPSTAPASRGWMRLSRVE